jgi:hypothetical protein
MFGRILIAIWVFIFGSVAILGVFPRLATKLPRPHFMFVFLFTFAVVSLVYGVVWLYRQGMKRSQT